MIRKTIGNRQVRISVTIEITCSKMIWTRPDGIGFRFEERPIAGSEKDGNGVVHTIGHRQVFSAVPVEVFDICPVRAPN